MTTSTFKVDDLLSSLGARGIEKQLKHISAQHNMENDSGL